MSQTAYPDSDVSTGSWTPKPIYAQIDEKTANDGDKVASSSDPEGDSFEVKLENLSWPKSGQQKLTVRLRKTSSDNLPVNVSLLQGSIVIANRFIKPTQSFGNAEIVLSDNEMASITNYHDLRLRVKAGVVTISDCGQCSKAPKEWQTIFSGFGEECDFNGTYILKHSIECRWEQADVAALDYSTSDSKWKLSIGPPPGETEPWVLYVLSGTFNCLGSNTFDYDSDLNCSTHPGSIEITPF